MLAVEARGRKITTVEGLGGDDLSPVQKAFIEKDGFQCGFCTPGWIMSVEGLLRKAPNPDDGAIRRALSGNLCRCAAYPKILEAARAATGKGGRHGR
jgi:aerobic-type carbon monoxide dehydrogenase small subunit (CoxS/CutS family)